MHEDATCNDLQKIITQAINEISRNKAKISTLPKLNLAELERRTGLSRSRLRHLKKITLLLRHMGGQDKNQQLRF